MGPLERANPWAYRRGTDAAARDRDLAIEELEAHAAELEHSDDPHRRLVERNFCLHQLDSLRTKKETDVLH